MKKDTALPERVFPKGRWYYLVVADGKRRVWNKLSLIRDGLPRLYAAYAEAMAAEVDANTMPGLIAEWQAKVMPRFAPKTRIDHVARCMVIAEQFADFRPEQVEPTDVTQFLEAWADKPRTHNAYRSLLRELMRYAMQRGLRPMGTNPCDVIPTAATKPRERCPTTSELRRVKVAALRHGKGGAGLTLAAAIELAYLSGQDAGVLVRIRERRDPQQPNEPHLNERGIFFRRDKTGGAVEILWTPRLRAVVAALRRLKAERALRRPAERRVATDYLLTRVDGQPMTYEALSNSFQRALKRSGVLPFMFRDIRARALTDKDEREGRAAANAMGTHTTEGQTADYIRHKAPRRTKATA